MGRRAVCCPEHAFKLTFVVVNLIECVWERCVDKQNRPHVLNFRETFNSSTKENYLRPWPFTFRFSIFYEFRYPWKGRETYKCDLRVSSREAQSNETFQDQGTGVICAVQYGSHMWLLNRWNVACVAEAMNFLFYLILIGFNLISLSWLPASLLERATLEAK